MRWKDASAVVSINPLLAKFKHRIKYESSAERTKPVFKEVGGLGYSSKPKLHIFQGDSRIIYVGFLVLEKRQADVVFLNAQIANEPYVLFIHVTKPPSREMKAVAIQRTLFCYGC